MRGYYDKYSSSSISYACGSLDSYSKLCHIDGIDLIKYELPGRRSRISEKLDSLNSVMIEVCNVINFNSPYVILVIVWDI